MELAPKFRRKLEELKEVGAEEYYRKHRLGMKEATKLADYIFSVYIREKEPYCACCGKTEALQCGHLFSRVFTGLRWDEDNAATQCAGCNMLHEHHPESFRRIMVVRHGEEKIASLWDRRLAGKTNAFERIEIALKYYDKYLSVR